MGALAGIVGRRDRHEVGDARLMLRAMGRRSAVAEAIVKGERCILATALAAGEEAAPGASVARSGSWMACAQTRLDDRDALSGALGLTDISDAELILAGYRKWGERLPERLGGEFAFAIWDPTKAALFVARDRFGVFPLCYRDDAGVLAIASEAKGLLTLASTPRRTPQIRIAEFLSGHAPPDDETFFADIRRLPPAHCGYLGQGSAKLRCYWRLELPEAYAGSDAASEFEARFRQAVGSRLPREGRGLVSMLSGGLDSSFVTAIARESMPARRPLATVSMVFPESPHGDESELIRCALADGDYDARFVQVLTPDPFERFDEALHVQDGLFLAPGLVMNRPLYETAEPGGVLLSGHGGDEVVSKGLGRLHDLAMAGRWATLRREINGAADLYGGSGRSLFAGYLINYGLGRGPMRRLRPLAQRLFEPAGRSAGGLATAALVRRYGSDLEARRARPVAGRSGRSLDLDVVRDPLQSYSLDVLDKASWAAGVESRYPFWDVEFIKFSLSLDPTRKLRDGWTRMILREAMAGHVPDRIRWRRDKYDFSPTIVRGMLASPACGVDRFQRDRDRLAPWINLDAVERARQALAVPDVRSMGAEGQILWRATALAEWLEFADRNNIRIV